MSGGNEPTSFDLTAVRKVLRLLEALRQTPTGHAIYRQVERMLEDSVAEQCRMQDVYLALVNNLLDAFARQMASDSPLRLQINLMRTRLQPPLTLSDLNALFSYLDVYTDSVQLSGLDERQLQGALQPLLDTFGGGGESMAPLSKLDVPPTAFADKSAVAADAQSFGTEPASDGALHDEQPGEVSGKAEQRVTSVYRSHLDARQKDIQKLQNTLAQQVLETISKNQEFGVLLEVVANELRQSGEIKDLENLRWTLIREIERLMQGHHDLADKLDSTHQYLQVIETDSRELSDELTRVRLLSLTDELTELPNRRAFLRRLEDEVARVQRYGFPLSLALIDLDKFKDVNDQYGHAAGDEVLRTYSKNILSIFRHHDLVARYGGEEFAVLLANTDEEGSSRALNKVRKRALETRWQCEGTAMQAPTFSAGLALYKPGESADAFIERADKALYRAKRLGRDRIEIDKTYMEGETDADQAAPAPAPAKKKPTKDK